MSRNSKSKLQIDFVIKALIFLLPLIFWPNPVKFESTKVALFLTGGLILAFWLLTQINQKMLLKKLNYTNKYWLIWITLLGFSTLWNQNFLGFLGSGYRHQGVIFFLILGLLAVSVKTLSKKGIKSILLGVTIATAAEILIISVQWVAINLKLPVLSYNLRPIGTFGEPNAAAGFLVLSLPIAVNYFSSTILRLILPLMSLTAIILTGSRTGFLAIAAELTIYVFLWKKRFLCKNIFIISAIFLLILTGIAGVWLEKDKSLLESRWLIWNLGLKAFTEKPLLGYGAEGIINVYERQYKLIDRPLKGIVIDRSHNIFLDVALYSGLIGLTIFIAWFWQLARTIIKQKHWTLVPLAGIFVFAFFQPLGVTHWVYIMFIISLNTKTRL